MCILLLISSLVVGIYKSKWKLIDKKKKILQAKLYVQLFLQNQIGDITKGIIYTTIFEKPERKYCKRNYMHNHFCKTRKGNIAKGTICTTIFTKPERVIICTSI